jgi:transcriptional regulator with XRE-family HTH domain
MANTGSAEQAERQILGRALKALRERAGLKQHEAAAKLGMTVQGWQLYEGGKRRFTEEQKARVTGALGYTPEHLMLERARRLAAPDEPPAEPDGEVIDLRSFAGPSSDRLRLADDTLVPWGEPGELVIFDRGRYPRRGGGCVVETAAGDKLVKLYERSDESHIYVSQLNPPRTDTLVRADLKGVYAVRLRGD